MSDLVTPEFTLMSLANGLLCCPCPASHKDGHSSLAEKGHWGGDDRVLGPSINRKKSLIGPLFSF